MGAGHAKFREAMSKLKLREMNFRFDFDGTRVLVNFMDGVGIENFRRTRSLGYGA